MQEQEIWPCFQGVATRRTTKGNKIENKKSQNNSNGNEKIK